MKKKDSLEDRPIAVVDDPSFDDHRPRGSHPERPERLAAARAGLDAAIPEAHQWLIVPSEASARELASVHDPAYLRDIEASLAAGFGLLDADTYFSPGTRKAALRAAGASMQMARAIVRREARSGIALVRPPGHHATPDRAMGFCVYNNISLAARAALDEGAGRIAIVDWDVHHGNGTEVAFEDDPRVLFISAHQWPFYPGTGAPTSIGRNEGAGTTANIALPAGSGPEDYAEAFRRVVLPLLDRFDADLTLVSAGFDAHGRDPLAGQELDAETFGAMATTLLRRGPVGFLLEGGYDLRAIEESVRAVARAIEGDETELSEERPRPQVRQAVRLTVDALRPYWPGVF